MAEIESQTDKIIKKLETEVAHLKKQVKKEFDYRPLTVEQRLHYLEVVVAEIRGWVQKINEIAQRQEAEKTKASNKETGS